MKFQKNKILIILFLLFYIGCSNNNEKKQDILKDPFFLLSLTRSNNTGNAAPSCNSTGNSSVTFSGTVVEGTDSNTSGIPLGLIEIQTSPVIFNITRTSVDGIFSSSSGICPDMNYTFTASKTGYVSKTIQAIAKAPVTNVSFVLQRDTTFYVFPTVVLKNSSNTFLTGATDNAVVGYSAGGSTIQFSTNSSGQASPAFPKTSSTIVVSATAKGYNDCSFTYIMSSGVVNNPSNCSITVTNGILSITMHSNSPPSNLNYKNSPYTLVSQMGIEPIIPVVSGLVDSYSVSPTLPEGLILDSTTGTIYGKPTVSQNKTSYTVTATNSFGSTTATFDITVSNPIIPSNLSYYGSLFTFTAGTAIAYLSPSVSGAITTYSVNPALPTGLTIDSATGIISGTPTIAQEEIQYSITASNSSGSTTTNIGIRINLPGAPTISYSGNPFTFGTGFSYSAPVSQAGGNAISYAISPSLPQGLTINSTTGSIFGSPTTAQASTNYTVTVTGSMGRTTDTVSIYIYPITSTVSTFAGSLSGFSHGYVNATGTAATFERPYGIAFDATSGSIYVADDTNHSIRKITSTGVVTTFAGSIYAYTGSTNATGTAARFTNPRGVAVDSTGNVYVADTGNALIRKITPAGVVTTFAGGNGYCCKNGTGTAASFSAPEGVAVDSNGNVYVADENMVRKITSSAVVSTLVNSGSYANGIMFANVYTIAVDSSKNLYIPAWYKDVIFKVTQTGTISIFAGSGSSKVSIDGNGTSASFYRPSGISIDTSGNLYVSDTFNRKIRKISSAGLVTTVAGSGSQGASNGGGVSATFNCPYGITVNPSNNELYVSDYCNYNIRKIVP